MNSSRSLKRIATISASGCVAAVAAILSSPAAAIAAAPTPVPVGAEYVALGSSFASGPGVPTTLDPFCARSRGNYAHVLASGLQLQLTDVTCGGATSDNIVSTSQKLPIGGQRAPQINAVTANADLVTITIGGNDVNYIGDLYRNSCQAPNNAPIPAIFASACTPANPAATQGALSVVQSKIVATVQAVQAKAPEARIVLVDYTTVLPQNAKPCTALPLTTEQIKYSLDVARQLQLATKHAAQQSGAELVELSKASRGHDVCSDDPWVTGWEFGPDFLFGGKVPYHPNAAGMQAASDLIAAHLS
ncbi:Lysophospholipase L1 [Nocardioides scoriae]|uniref:Lysophospholipase L1 n=1 Tax=Nocardioides scoriae TaxID=642780 RepID=A0A1H1VKA0_9ACTN|nr:SGNH/GDSL hydrolase family protein [Nocardioides scoriae]SDS84459.1 Lysophospholipase L1 [Nocardioides scoriae]